MCAVINDYFTSALYLEKVKKCFQTAELHDVHNRICTKVHFELLTKVVQSEKQKMDSLIASTAGPVSTDMPDHERAILRHVCGATIHKVCLWNYNSQSYKIYVHLQVLTKCTKPGLSTNVPN